ncbi:MAG: type I-E CRISPR-associated protein Cas5/CasD [Anaerolineae bacterium]|nr:type I-E CRISPR-associated protein Cas5/CasD [Anaerolineae bacterium]
MANTLFLRLEGPLQSWGERARWDVRDTAPEPTKSGIVGLLACALGLSADEDLRTLSQSIRVGVRCDRPGALLTDYHTIIGGVMGGDGKIKPGTVISRRAYLCDASFLVAIQATPETIGRLAQAIQAPTWAIYLGRKSCPPACPPFEGVGDYPTLEAALADWPWYQWNVESGTTQVRAVLESQKSTGARRRDEIISRSRRTYNPRYTYDVPVTVQIRPKDLPGLNSGGAPCTSPA